METSEEVKELVTALSKAQGLIAGAVKDVENKFLKTMYADLASVWEVARKPLSDNGLSVVQSPENSESGGVKLITRVYHSSGEWMESSIDIPVQKQDSQGYGTTISYARRYSLAAMIGIYSEDDDGQSNNDDGKKPKKDIKKLLVPDGEQMKKLQALRQDPDYKESMIELGKKGKLFQPNSEEEAEKLFNLIVSFKPVEKTEDQPKKESEETQFDPHDTGGDEYF